MSKELDRMSKSVTNTLEHYANRKSWRKNDRGEWVFVGRMEGDFPGERARRALATFLDFQTEERPPCTQ